MIKELSDDVKSYIRSGVAITSLTQCVEELLLNSIDAGATNVAVRVDVPCFKVQVVDNGHGIPEEELPLIGNRYTTSKCHTVADLEDLRYFGYRGEALASIKDACGILEIVTRTKTSAKPLCKLFQDGKPLPIAESAIPRPSVGTTITVHALFMNFPVRQKSQNESLELEKIRQRVAGLALMKPQVSVRLRNDANGATIIHTKKCSSTLVTFASLFGQTKAQYLVEINGAKGHFTVEGYFGKEGSTKKDIQFVYVNGRLVLKTKIHKVINDLLKKSAICKKKFDLSLVSPTLPVGDEGFQKTPGKQLDKQPVFIVNVKCPLTEYDITFDPAKTLVEFKDWDTLLQNIIEITNDFLKKEKLSLNQSDLNQESNGRTESGENKLVSEISPLNIKDALISRPARRPGYKPNLNMKTPVCLPLEKWKAENNDHMKLSDITISSSISDEANNPDVLKKFCDTCIETSSNKTDIDTEDTKAIDGVNDCDNKAACDKPEQFRKESELQIQSNVPGKPISPCSSRGCPRSGLSLFRKSIGKSTGVFPLKGVANIDNNLDRISKLLPSSSRSHGKGLSSLQRFRKYASKYCKQDKLLTDPEMEVLPPKFCRLNHVPRIEPHDNHFVVTPCKTDDKLPEKSSIIDDTTKTEYKTNHIEPNDIYQVTKTSDNSSNKNNPDIHDKSYQQCNVPVNFQHQSYSYRKLTSDESILRNHILNSSFQFERQHMRPGLKVYNQGLGLTDHADDIPSYSDRDVNGMTGNNSNLLDQALRSEWIKSDKFESIKNLSTKVADRKRPGSYYEEIAHKVTRLEDANAGNFKQRNEESSEGIQPCFKDVEAQSLKNKAEIYRLDNQENDLQHNKKSFDIVYDIDEPRNACNTEHLAGSREIYNNTNKATSVFPVECDSPNSIRGSQLFKNLPDVEIVGSQDSNNSEMLIAVPLDTNKVIQSIVMAGLNLPDNPQYGYSSQEFICGTESQDINTEQLPGISDMIKEGSNYHEIDADTEHMNTTQEFTPGYKETNVQIEEHKHDDNNSEVSNIDKSPDKVSNHTSPLSTGFTPRLDEDTSPLCENASVNTNTSPCPKNVANMNELSMGESEQMRDNVKSDEYEDAEITQDTLDMPSIMERSRFDMSVTDPKEITQDTLDMPSIMERSRFDMSVTDPKEITQDTLEIPAIMERSRFDMSVTDPKDTVSPTDSEQESDLVNQSCMQGTYGSTTQSGGASGRNVDQAGDFKDDVTISQLLDTERCEASSSGCHRHSEDVVTFRDIFTPTQSQTDTQNSSEPTKATANVDELTSVPEENIDGFSDTFDEELQNVNSQVFASIAKKGRHSSQMVTKNSPKPELAEGNGKQTKELNLEQDIEKSGQEENSSNETEGHWIETKHPDTGKTVYVHSNLGIVVDQIDTSLSKLLSDKDTNGVTAKSTKNFETKKKEEVTSEKPEVKAVALSSLQRMFDKHLEKKEEEADIKWRDKQQKPGVETESSSITELFSEWENPVFDNIRKSVKNVEISNSTSSRSTLKAMKTLHTCRFTKEMLKSVQVIGQLDKKFIVCLIQTDNSASGPDLLAVIDQHAAHERVRIELLTEEAYIEGNVERAELAKFSVDPAQSVKMDQDEIQVMMSFRDEFSRIGITFRVDTHADDMIKVLTVPECLVVKNTSDVPKKELIYWDTIQTLIKGHVELLLSTEGAKGRLPSIIHKLLCSQACHGAIKFGDKLTPTDCKSLIHDLSLCDLPFQCAHGRPSVMPILQLQQLDTKLPKMKQPKPQLHKLRLALENRKINKEDEGRPTVQGKKSSFCHAS